ncbi:MAG: GGDEF domain-containing protein [Deltaproteobacteria bacterium]|nr:GGDEF domain-containing protein [Deltaproteobacteria bacterium]
MMTQISDNNSTLLDLAVRDLQALLTAPKVSLEPPEALADVDGYRQLYATLLEVRTAILMFASGNFDYQVTEKGFLPGSIKSLQASLRHLTWQTKRIASGDFTQRVEFMGEFSESFNSMVILLDQSMRKLELIAHTDPLTGSNNRGYFMERLGTELDRTKRYGSIFCIVMLDLDHFKSVNDKLGHAAGDEALRSLCRVINSSGLRSADFFGRIGGEEFAIVLPETKIKGGIEVAERVRINMENTAVIHENNEFFITASLGVSEYRAGDTRESLLNRADQAMYRAKETGRNRVCVES